MRKARSVAWFSTAGFHQRSKCTTWEAAVRLSPAPPALSESTKNPTASSSWNRRTSSLRFFTSVCSVKNQPGPPENRSQESRERSGHFAKLCEDKTFSCLAAMTSAMSRKRAHLPLSSSLQAPSPSH